jgi:hypothetical protein
MRNKEVNLMGVVPVEDMPVTRYERGENRATFCREMLNSLQPGKAHVYEFADHKMARDYRSMLHSMAILKYGEGGHVGTKTIENIMYVWLTKEGEA